VVNSEERDTVCVGEGNGGSEVSGRVLIKGQENVVNQEEIDRGMNENSSNLVGEVVCETLVVIHADEVLCIGGDDRGSGARSNEFESSKVSAKEAKTRVSELERNACVIDVKCGSGKGFGENCDGERVCRICHLSSEQSSDGTTVVTSNANMTSTTDLIELGCGCKDELGIAHSYCADTWFKLKGNRLCEICGQTAKNITGVGGNRFVEEWNERRFTGGSSNSSNRGRGCWRGQPFCNFLMACLVIAFVLPWFFRVNMF